MLIKTVASLESGRWCSAQHWWLWADCVEKLRISDAVIFRKEPAIPKSQMRSATRRSELGYEWQKTNLAEPLASKSWLRRTGKNFADFAKNGVFQQYRLLEAIRCDCERCFIRFYMLMAAMRGDLNRSTQHTRRTSLLASDIARSCEAVR